MDQTETPAPGEAPIMRPLGAGDPAPTFMLPDPDDVMISSAELLENGPLVVTFYRGIWCPYCRQDLKDLGNAAPDIRSCGASLVAIDAGSNQVIATIGTLPNTTATALSATFRSDADTGFLEASNPVSTQDPATRDLYLLNSQSANSLMLITGNL